MQKVILLFLASILLTAVFSYSLNVYMHEGFWLLSLKTMLIPCFTWSILILFAWRNLVPGRRLEYLKIAGTVCAIGSLLLVPGGIYNFTAAAPEVKYAILNVLVCVAVMSILFFLFLRQKGFSITWWWAFNALICLNMTFFYLSIDV